MKKVSERKYKKIKRSILKRLYSDKAFRKSYLSFETLQLGSPSHLIGCIRFILDELIKQSLVVYYSKIKRDLTYQLNIKKSKEIEEIIFI